MLQDLLTFILSLLTSTVSLASRGEAEHFYGTIHNNLIDLPRPAAPTHCCAFLPLYCLNSLIKWV